MNKDQVKRRLLSFTLLALIVASAHAANRVDAGQWETTIEQGGQTHVLKACVTAAEAAAANGDDKTFLESMTKASAKAMAGMGCTFDAKVSGNQVISNSTCHGKQVSSTTTYHGDWYEQVSSNGSKVHAKRIGACS
jgi:hypothetical protein